jgi:membrane-associated phospholipid phosphatase
MKPVRALHLRATAWAAGAIAAIVLLALFADRPIAAYAAAADGPLFDLLRSITHVGRAQWWLVAIAVALVALAAWRRWTGSARDAALLSWAMAGLLFIAAAIAIPGLIGDVVKFVGGRPRPRALGDAAFFDFAPFGFDSDYHSFPSGHATTLFGLAFAVGFLLPRLRWLLLLLAAVIASARLFVNAHYASDLVAGGALAALVAYGLRAWLADRRLVFVRRADGSIRPRPAGRLLCGRIARLSRPPRPARRGSAESRKTARAR